MSDAVVHEQLATEPTVPAHLEDNAVNGVTADVSAEEASGTTTEPIITQSEIIAEPSNVASGDSAAAEAAVGTKAAQVTSAAVDGDTQTSSSKAPIEASIPAETTAEADPLVEDVEAASAASDAADVADVDAEAEQDDGDFVPPDMEHIVSSGAAQDGPSSMEALRELVAQARASTGQPREALPPGFDDDAEIDAVPSPPTQAQRGEKRKAEAELEELVSASAGIEEVKAAAEKSRHPETKTLLQKALSSISGLVSRRPKADTSAAASPTTEAASATVKHEEGKASDGSDSDSDSDSSSGDSSDDESDEDGDAGGAGLALAMDDDDDEDGGGTSGSIAPVTKNEILAPEVEQPALQEISEADKQTLRKLGKVHSIVDSVVVVEQDVQQSKQPEAASVPVDSTGRQGERQGEYSVLDTGSLLCFEDGKVLGLVFETFGSIHSPMYSIRFASAAATDRDVVEKGKDVFYLPAQSTYVLTQLLRSMKGSDASNIWDEEVGEDEIDYSDDEQEAEAKRRAKAIRSGKVDDQGNPLPAASARGNKRQKQGAPQPSQSNGNQQRPGQAGAGRNGHNSVQPGAYNQRPSNNGPASLPRRNPSAPGLPLPPMPIASASSTSSSSAPLAPAFPHGIASLPPRPSAGLPSKPPSATLPNGNGMADSQSVTAPRSRMSTGEGTPGSQVHSRVPSASAIGLPAKPVDAAAAAAAMSSASPKAASQQRTSVPGMGVSSPPPHPSRPNPANRVAFPGHPGSGYAHQGSPGWYGGSISASSSTPGSPVGPSAHGVPRNNAYSPGSAAPIAHAGGHYNPAYAAHWQQQQHQHAAPPAHQSGGMHWNASQAYQPPPLHMTPGSAPTHGHSQYGGYGSQHGGYGGAAAAAQGGHWNNQSYPGSHYPGYGAASSAQIGHYAPQPHSYGYAGYSNQPAGADAYNAYGYSAPATAAASSAASAATTAAPSAQDSYDPRSPSMSGAVNGSSQNAAAAGAAPQGQGQG